MGQKSCERSILHLSVHYHQGGRTQPFLRCFVVAVVVSLAYLKAGSPEPAPLLGLDMSVLSSGELTGTTDVVMIAQLDGLVNQKSERS
jgi:hypothetical protein